MAYKAKDRNDIIAGIDEFLDQVTVLPPGEWDPSIRIEPPKNVPSQVSAGCLDSQWQSVNGANTITANLCKTGEEEEKQHPP